MSGTTSFSSAWALLAAAFVVGLSGAMSPGSYLTVTVARTMRRGPWSAALMLVGHALLEALLLIGFAFGLQNLLSHPSVLNALALVGGAVLVWLGIDLLRGSLSGRIALDLDSAEHAGMSDHPVAAVAQGAVVSLSNPYWTLWWVTIGVKLASDGLAFGPLGVLAFFVGHELADIVWYGFVIFAVHRGRGLLTPRVYRATIGILATFLVYIGARFIGHPLGVDLPWLPF